MDLATLKDCCLAKKGAWEGFPFGDDVLVISVGKKIFAIISLKANPLKISLKCDPLAADGLRRKYPAVKPGYHLNKNHWNTVEDDGSIPESEIMEMIDHSYALVFSGLKKSEREIIDNASY